MDIRTKLVFALVAVSLASMFVFGAVTYGFTSRLLEKAAVRQLESVAEGKSQDLERVIVAWRDRVRLIASRTQLKLALHDLRRTGDPAARAQIVGTLTDALASVPALRGISVYTSEGTAVASIGLDDRPGERMDPFVFWAADQPVVYQDVFLDPDGQVALSFLAPIRLRGELVGAAKVILGAYELVQITQDHTGLGETGETLLARRTPDGGALILNPLRHAQDAALSLVIPPERTDTPALRAVNGVETVMRDGARDYRGEPVWAATRTLEEFDWGVVVKIDRAEERRPIVELRSIMWRLAVSLSAFAIVAGTLLGFVFARPIRELAAVAARIRGGELDQRAREGGDDEIGRLAAMFNGMAEELIRKNRALEDRIRRHPLKPTEPPG